MLWIRVPLAEWIIAMLWNSITYQYN